MPLMQMCIQNTTAGVHCLTWPYKQHQHPWKSISGFCGCVCLACPYQDQYLLLFIHIPFCSHSCLLATQKALNQNEYHQHVKATQILDFNPNKVRALHQWLDIMIRFDMPGKQAKDGNDFIMWAPQTHHPLDVPTKMESIMHLNKLAKQFEKWLKNHSKEPAGNESGNNQFNFIKNEVGRSGDDDNDGTENSTKDVLRESTDLHSRGRGLFTLREVLMKRHCILKEVSRVRTRDEGTESQPDELWITRLTLWLHRTRMKNENTG